jgi:glycosyltransferase involved in cell wall biosynthesis
VSISVLVDATSLLDEGSSLRGFGRYVRAVLDSVPGHDGIEMSALAPGRIDASPSIPRVAISRRLTEGRWTFYEHGVRLGLDVARAKPDVFHSPINDPPMLCTRPWVQTLHDVIPLLSTNPVHTIERSRWRWRGLAMRRADRVIAITRHAADTGIRLLGLRPERVRVIHHGVNPTFGPPEVRVEPDPPFLLYVGGYGPDKGFPEAFEMIERLGRAGYPHRLKIVGSVNQWARQFVDPLMTTATRVDLLGAVDDDELVRLYHTATALVVTSRAEGFGRPPIEAMASATPIVSFDNTSLPEVIGDGGLLVADGDVEAFVIAVRSLVDDDAARAELAAKAHARVGAFSWERCASDHAEVYREVAEGRSGR